MGQRFGCGAQQFRRRARLHPRRFELGPNGDSLIGPAVLADQRHESHGAEILLMERMLAIAHDLDQSLLVGKHADGHDQASADL